jgi:hypothetical protein
MAASTAESVPSSFFILTGKKPVRAFIVIASKPSTAKTATNADIQIIKRLFSIPLLLKKATQITLLKNKSPIPGKH